MRTVDETRIDDKCRTSALSGLVKPGERYKVMKPSDGELRLVRMVALEPKPPKVKVVTVRGRKLLTSDRIMTNADTEGAMDQFP